MLIYTVDVDLTVSLLKNLSIGYFILVVLLHFCDKIFMGLKWNFLLKAFEIKIPIRLPVLAYLRSRVLNFVIPAGIDIDAYKVYYIKKFTNRITETIASVLTERLIGAISSLSFISLFIYFPSKYHNFKGLYIITAMGFIAFSIISIAVFFFDPIFCELK